MSCLLYSWMRFTWISNNALTLRSTSPSLRAKTSFLNLSWEKSKPSLKKWKWKKTEKPQFFLNKIWKDWSRVKNSIKEINHTLAFLLTAINFIWKAPSSTNSRSFSKHIKLVIHSSHPSRSVSKSLNGRFARCTQRRGVTPFVLLLNFSGKSS